MPPPATPSGYPTHTHHKRAESTLGAAALPCMQPLSPSCCSLSRTLQRRPPEEGRREWLGGAARAIYACYGSGYAVYMIYEQCACVGSMLKHVYMRYLWATCSWEPASARKCQQGQQHISLRAHLCASMSANSHSHMHPGTVRDVCREVRPHIKKVPHDERLRKHCSASAGCMSSAASAGGASTATHLTSRSSRPKRCAITPEGATAAALDCSCGRGAPGAASGAFNIFRVSGTIKSD